MKLSEIKGEDALDVLGDLLDPATAIASNEGFQKIVNNGSKLDVVKYLMKNCKKEILAILAILDRKDPETYEPTLPEIPMKILELINDPAFASFFDSQSRSQGRASSGSATENTGATEKE